MARDFASAVRSDDAWGAVVERDDGAIYFYLLDLSRPDGQRIVGALNIGQLLAENDDFDVKWSGAGVLVGAFAGGRLLAVHDVGQVGNSGRMASAADEALFA